MRFIGDCHGKTRYLEVIRKRYPNETMFQLGDMGLGFPNVSLATLERFRFIRGNHDSPSLCQQHPCYAGEWGGDEHFFYVGGAWSIDWKWRVPGVSWWPDEELSEDQLSKAVEAYRTLKPRIVASHEAPASIGQRLLEDGFRPEKVECFKTRTAEALQQMLDFHKPEHWFFGHYHRNWTFNLEHSGGVSIFHCLNELSVSEDIKI